MNRGKLILLVEDEPLIRFLCEEMFEGAGFTVLSAENADIALDILNKVAGIRVVVSDITMPGSMDGLSLARLISQRWPDIQIILASGRHRLTAAELPRSSFC